MRQADVVSTPGYPLSREAWLEPTEGRLGYCWFVQGNLSLFELFFSFAMVLSKWRGTAGK